MDTDTHLHTHTDTDRETDMHTHRGRHTHATETFSFLTDFLVHNYSASWTCPLLAMARANYLRRKLSCEGMGRDSVGILTRIGPS